MTAELARFQKNFINFGVEVVKFPRSGAPAPRSILLSLDPPRLYWVGKGGKSKIFQLDPSLSIKRGHYPSESVPAIFPTEQFRKYGKAENAGCYVSLKNSAIQIDLEFQTVDELENFLIIIEHIHSTLSIETDLKQEVVS